MPCTFCSEEKVVAKGLCRNCYYRKRRTGTLEYKCKGKSLLACSFEGCDSPHVARGYCEAHYRTLRKHGDVISPFGYGEREKHPLYRSWVWQQRVSERRVSAWNDFWEFVASVPAKPSPKHRAKRYDVEAPWGPDNFYWKDFGKKAESAVVAARIWRNKNRLKGKGYDLNKSHGISFKTYLEMYDRQKGRCFICDTKGKSFSQKVGVTLAVDHCHKGKQIRALLCPLCNMGLGCFKDSSALLTKAAAYLVTHKLQP